MASKTTRPSAAALRGCIRFSLLGFSALTLSLVVVSGALALLLIRSSQVRTMAFRPFESSGPASVSSLLADVTGRQPGPWGEMVFTDADMEVPVEFAAFDDNINTNRITAWRFEQMQPADVRSLMQDCGLTAAQVEAACAPEIIAADPSGTTVRPDDALILSLSPGPREKLYTRLAASSANLYMPTRSSIRDTPSTASCGTAG